jgi:hypothetical protein
LAYSCLTKLSLLIAGCTCSDRFGVFFDADCGAIEDGTSRAIPPADLSAIDPGSLHHEVTWRGHKRPGRIVVNVSDGSST